MKRTLQSITCQLCGETHPSNGIHTHLKYKHGGMTTSEYFTTFGDFRANTKKTDRLRSGKKKYKCLLCNDSKEYTTTALSFHLIKSHSTNKNEYILNCLLNGNQPMCKCGCGKPTRIVSYDPPHATKYASGHNKSTLGYTFSETSRRKMSLSATNRLNSFREIGVKPTIWTRKCIFDRVYGTMENYQSVLQCREIKCLSTISEIYSDNTDIQFLCISSGKVFSQISLDAISPYLKKTKSKYQDDLVVFIKSMLPNVDVIENTQKILDNRKEIDIYIPSLKIGIEFDGLYWHSEFVGKKPATYHVWKTENANKKGIRIIHIFEDEWRDKKSIVQNKLRSILGISSDRRVFARKCTVKSISASQKDEFLMKFHIQGRDKSATKLGLFYQDELVAVMTFSQPNVSKGKTTRSFMELSRYATSCNVIGGAGKLLAFYRKEYVGKIVTYADRRWSTENDNLYVKLGFRFIKNTQCNYFYMKDYKNRLHRFGFTKSKLVALGGDPNKTEWQLMRESGYDRIWDCGHIRYELE